MEKIQIDLTEGTIMDLLGSTNTEGFKRLRELVAKQGDTAFESFVHTLDHLIGLHI